MRILKKEFDFNSEIAQDHLRHFSESKEIVT